MKTGNLLRIIKGGADTLIARAVVLVLVVSIIFPQSILLAQESTDGGEQEVAEPEQSQEGSEKLDIGDESELEGIDLEGGEMMSLLGEEDPSSSIDVPGLFSSKQILPEVERSTGALNQQITFSIPPGRNGLTPDVSLIYNSQQLEDDIAGYGWAVSVPSIKRFNKTGSENIYSDDFFTSSLGGELVETSTPGEYVHRLEGGEFVRYTFTNSTWIAYDKLGTRYTFGTTTAARHVATSTPDNVYAWMLEEVRDTNDNFIRFEYTKDSNEIYASKITYTGHGSTDGVFEIDFTYETRPDQFTSYETGFRVDTTKRLTEVRASVNDQWVRKYVLTYASGVNGLRSLLASIQETGRDEEENELSVPATSFGYSSSTPQFENFANPRIWNHARVASDIDGNGLPDRAVFWSNSTTTASSRLIDENEYPLFSSTTVATTSEFWASYNVGESGSTEYSILERGTRLFDLNGDGRADILRSFKDINGVVFRKYYQNSGGLGWIATSTPYATPVFSCDLGSIRLPTGIFGEVNGDGLTDYVASSTSCGINGTFLGNGKEAWSSTSAFASVASMSTTTVNTTDLRASQFVDINADGLDDWMYSDGGQIQFFLNTGTGWGGADSRWTIATTTRHANGWDRGIRFFDVNGDKLPDYVRAYTMPSYSSKAAGVSDIEIGTSNYVNLNTGSGFATSSLTMPEYIFNGVASSSVWAGKIDYNEFVDWNGDGILDSAGKISTSTAIARADVLVQTTYPTGGRTLVEHSLRLKWQVQMPNCHIRCSL